MTTLLTKLEYLQIEIASQPVQTPALATLETYQPFFEELERIIELAQRIDEKFSSGNDIPVPRITMNRDEYVSLRGEINE